MNTVDDSRPRETSTSRLLTAQWRHLLMVNFPVDPGVLEPHVPEGTELDPWNGTHLVSLVGLRFFDTRLAGIPVPLHREFDEVNLRFYVRRRLPDGWRRGTVFLKEVVSLPAVALMARLLVNENYVVRKLRSRLRLPQGGTPGLVDYRWRHRGRWLRIAAGTRGEPALPEPGSEPSFLVEHYWGYCRQRNGSTAEYRVEHPPWRLWSAEEPVWEGDFSEFYGAEFGAALAGAPSSVFVAEGSPVVVRKGRRLDLHRQHTPAVGGAGV